jgi:hypothetical protein
MGMASERRTEEDWSEEEIEIGVAASEALVMEG